MSNLSFVYRSIHIYRAVMNLLYRGNYNKRFTYITELIDGGKVTELCFGDIKIAGFCRDRGIQWIGYDINHHFVDYAKSLGFDARLANLKEIQILPETDICIMAGSLYHFSDDIEGLLSKMLAASKKIIISEPVINLSSSKGIIGILAKRSASVGERTESFRFDTPALIKVLNHLSPKLSFQFKVVREFNKDIIIVIEKV